MTTPEPSYPSSPNVLPFVGRAAELEILRDHLDMSGESKCVYISAPAGMGKTALLKEFVTRISDTADVRCSSIIDLYHKKFSSPDLLRKTLVDQIDPEEKYFHNFRRNQEGYQQLVVQGAQMTTINEHGQLLDRSFIDDWDVLALDSKRLVIIFDTFERIAYIPDDTIRHWMMISDDNSIIQGWFLEILPNLKNTLIIMAGRNEFQSERYLFLAQLNQAFNHAIALIELHPLSLEEVSEFYQSIKDSPDPIQDNFPEKILEKIYEQSHGNPLFIKALLSFYLSGSQFSEVDDHQHKNAQGLAIEVLRDLSAMNSRNEMFKPLHNTASVDDLSQEEPMIGLKWYYAYALAENARRSRRDISDFVLQYELALNSAKASFIDIDRRNRDSTEQIVSKALSEHSRRTDRSEIERFDAVKWLSQTKRNELLSKRISLKDENDNDNLSVQPVRRIKRISVNEALQVGNCIVILGDPGSGKTTLLKYILLAHAENQLERLKQQVRRLPLFIRLYDYAARRAKRTSDYSLIDYLYTQAHESYILNLAPGFFEERLQAGTCCVCLDGLDELGDSGLRQEIVQEVDALSNRYPNNQFIITSRLVGYQEAPLNWERFAHFTILPFTDEDIHQFVGKWYAAREKDPGVAHEQAQNLVATIMTEDRIRALASNPLMLTIIALVHRIEAELPNERVKLYDKCVTTLTDTWDKVKGLKLTSRDQIHFQTHRRLLERLAYWMHCQSGATGQAYEIREGDLLLQLREFLLQDDRFEFSPEQASDEARLLVELVQARTGILIERGDGVYAFVHLTFQEYLAACDIEHRCGHSVDGLWQEIYPWLYDPHWREVLLLLFGSLNKFERYNTELVERLLSTGPTSVEIDYQALFLAARILSDHVIIKAALRHRIFDTLVDIIRKGDIWAPQALEKLVEFRQEPMARELLCLLILNRSLPVQIRAKILSAFREFDEIDAELLDTIRQIVFASDDDWEVRQDAAYTLGCVGETQQALKFLLECTKNKKLPISDRSRAILYVGRLPVVEPLALAQVRDVVVAGKIHNPEILIAAGEALAMLGDLDHALPVFKQLLKSSTTFSNENFRIFIIELMGKYGSNDDSTVGELLRIAQSESIKSPMRLAACKMLAITGQKDIVIPILKRMSHKWSNSAKEHVRIETALLMDYLNQKEDAIQILLQMGRSKKVSFEAKCQAVLALQQMGEVSAALDIGHLLETEDEWNSEHKLLLAQVFSRLGQKTPAVDILKMVVNSTQSKNNYKMIAFDLLLKNDQEEFVNQIYQQIGNLFADAARAAQ